MTTITDKLAEAIELVEDAMAYVPEYFANKHGMNRRMAAMKDEFAAYASQQGEPSSGSNAAAPVVVEPSDARVEAAAKAIADVSEAGWLTLEERHQDEYRSEARAVLKAADAVSPSTRPADVSKSGDEIDVSAVPHGWRIERMADGRIVVESDERSIAVLVAEEASEARELPEVALWALADSLLAAPGSEQKEGANG